MINFNTNHHLARMFFLIQIFLLISWNIAKAEVCASHSFMCEIGELNVEVSECDAVGEFFVVINFEHANTTGQFSVLGNGNDYGDFSYADLPITINGLSGDCETSYEFVVIDNEFENCAADAGIGEICCGTEECEIGELSIEVSECDAVGEFFVVINFEHANTTGQFSVLGNGSDYGDFSYVDLPITIDGLSGDCETSYEFVVIDNEFENCASDIGIGEICCGTEECEIGELNVEVSECNDGDEFFVVINFEHANTTGQFSVLGNGSNYGDFSYADLPITIDGLSGDCETSYEFVVIDNEFENCAADAGIGEICCGTEECEIGELNVEVSECNDGDEFFVVINFEHANTTGQFNVLGNGSDYGDFSYADLPITIDGLSGDCETSYEFVVIDNELENCASDIGIGEICCGTEECEIGELNVEVSECDAVGEFFVVINFEHANTTGQFSVLGNGNNYGDFSYTDLPITIDGLVADCETSYEFVVIDNEFENCASDIGIGEICCGTGECEIGELNIEVSECNDGDQFLVVINFEHANTTGQFSVLGNGNDYGDFSYADLPITIDGLVGDCETSYEFVVIDNELENCAADAGIGEICCGTEECEIGELSIEVSECNDGDEFFVVINFEHANTTGQFSVLGNGNDYGDFSYADLPITIDGLSGDCETSYEFVVIDNEFENCASDIGIGEICCGMEECEIGELSIEVSECNDGDEFFVVINFEHANTTGQFSVLGNGSDYGDFSYADLPITIDGLSGDCETSYEFVVIDNEFENCASDAGIGEICCGTEECEIGELNIEVSECNDGDEFFVVINFDHANTTGQFSVLGNGNNYGDFSYTDLPITIDGLVADCETSYEFVVIDNELENCAADAGIGEICCGTEECEIGELNVEVSECNDGGEFFVVINFEHANTTGQFSVLGNGSDYGDFSYADLPITIDGLSGDCETSYEFVVIDNEFENCAADAGIGEICCGTEECEIGELSIEVSECNDGDEFFVVINFEHANTTGQFSVLGNGNDYGDFSYADLPITIDGLSGDCETSYEFVVIDNEFENCAADAGIGEICCGTEECEIGELSIEVSECDAVGEFFVVINFEHGNTTGQFSVLGNGSDYGDFSYVDLPITIDGLSGDCETSYEFVVIDNEFEDCAADAGIGEICCGTEECEIGELNVEVSECNDGDEFFVVINFEHANTTGQFSVLGNGNDYGNFSYADLPITIDGLSGDCETSYEFVVIDNEFENCASDIGIGEICCGTEECEIGELNIEVSECDAVGEFFVVINFEHANTTGQFSVLGNGNDYGDFSYADLPITINGLSGDCETSYEFVVIDNEFENCAADAGIGEICCGTEECEIGEIDLSLLFCDGENYSISIDFDYQNVNQAGFDLWLNNEFYGFYQFENLPIELSLLENTGETQVITVCSNDNEDCCSNLEYQIPCATSVEDELIKDVKSYIKENHLIIDNPSVFDLVFGMYGIDGKRVMDNNEVKSLSMESYGVDLIKGGIYVLVIEYPFGLISRKIFIPLD